MAYKVKNSFYDTKKWLRKRANVLRRDEYRCKECLRYGTTREAEMVHHIYPLEQYPQYILTDINLLSLCDSCHGKMHDRFNNTVTKLGMYWQQKIQLDLGIADTDIIDTFRVVVVWGSPGSGKTTYVKQRMHAGDMVVDLDYIKQAISMQGKTASISNLMPVALDIREHIYDLISKRDIIQTETVWVVAGLPKHEDREYTRRRLRPNDMVHINSDMERCIEQAMSDAERHDKDIQVKIIRKWFEDYQEPPL